MSVEIVTKEDLQHLRLQLINDLKDFVVQVKSEIASPSLEGMKTKHVRKILDCSYNKVQALRIAGKLRCNKVGGTLYFNKQDVQKLLQEGYDKK